MPVYRLLSRLYNVSSLYLYRWMVRSSYGIGDPNSCCNDCLLSTFCGACVANQLYQVIFCYGFLKYYKSILNRPLRREEFLLMMAEEISMSMKL